MCSRLLSIYAFTIACYAKGIIRRKQGIRDLLSDCRCIERLYLERGCTSVSDGCCANKNVPVRS